LASQFWYADFIVRGQRRVVALKVPVEGKLPDRKGKGGDADFYKSKGKAQHVHDETVRDAHIKAGADKLVERLVEIKTGEKVRAVPLDKLVKSWLAIPRKKEPSPEHVKNRTAVLTRFIKYITTHYPKVKELAGLTAAQVKAYMDNEQVRGLSERTWNVTLELLRSVFRHLEPGSDAYRKYLSTVPTKTESTIHREPFSADDITAIMEAARDDDLMRPLITTALCTAMRRGDCALLKWSSVDMKQGFLTVKTSKTGDTVEIPIMPLLRDELSRLHDGKGKGEHVFPEAARLYKDRPDVLDSRLKRILLAAGFVEEDPDEEEDEEDEKKKPLPSLPPEELREKAMTVIDSAAIPAARRERFKAVFLGYTSGKTVAQVAAEVGISSGMVSICLNKLESLLKVAVVRRKGPPVPTVVRGTLYSNGSGQRMKRGSLRGWHSFRTTFITLALSAGLPMELVRRVTGHTTVDVVLKHYFRPGREDFKRALQAAMPKMLTNGEKTPKEQVLEILDGITAKTWKKDVERVVILVKGM